MGARRADSGAAEGLAEAFEAAEGGFEAMEGLAEAAGAAEGLAGASKTGTATVQRCKCKVPVYTVGYREGVLKEIVEEYKFNSLRAASAVLAELIDEVLPEEMGEVAIVPLPTASKHIRERGFDHTKLLAKKLARRRKEFSVSPVLKRKGQKVQVGKGEKERKAQAAEAYEADIGAIDAGKTYLLLDDVWTTGASMEAAIAVMKKAGARRLMAAVIEIPGLITILCCCLCLELHRKGLLS